MTNPPSTKFKIATVVWAVLLSVGIIALAGSILMPSTKRARIDLTERLEDEPVKSGTVVPPASRGS
jgi:hypothetical protein